MKKSIGFIGGGRVTKILIKAFMNKSEPFLRIVVAEPNKDVRDSLQKLFPFILFEDSSIAASQEIVFISLHPPVIMDISSFLRSFDKNLEVHSAGTEPGKQVNQTAVKLMKEGWH